MRVLTDHHPANDRLKIEVTDQPGAGGANHRYEITGYNASRNPSAARGDHYFTRTTILFQNGAIPDAGVNGLTQEALLAIVADRLRAFQAGPFACKENAAALAKVEEAMMWLHQRTRDRMARQVEGTHTV